MELTTLAIAVDSTQVNSAATALDRMSASGDKTVSTTTRLTKAALDQGKAMRVEAQDTDKAVSSVNALAAANAKAAETGSKAARAPAAAPVGAVPAAVAAVAPPTAGVNAFTAATEKAAASTKRLQESEQALAVASANAAAAQAALTAATGRNAAAQQQLAVATSSGLASQGEIAQAQQRAAASQAAMLGAQARVATTTQAATKAAEAHRRALASMGRQTALTANETAQLAFQLQDFGVQVAGGANPLLALVQQGSQLAGTFGGVGGAFRAVLSLLTPMRVGLIGVGAAAGGFALAAAGAENFARSLGEVQAALAGTGRRGAVSDAGLSDLIDQIAELPGVSRDAAQATVTEFARVREIGTDMFAGLASLAVDYARVTGKELPAATKELVQAFAAPARGAKSLDDQLGTLQASTLLTTQKLEDQGNLLGAQRILYADLTRAIGGLAKEGVTPLQEATDRLSNAWDKAMGSLRQSDVLRGIVDDLAKLVGGMEKVIDVYQRADVAWRRGPGRFMPGATPEFTGGASASFDAPGGASGSFGGAAAAASGSAVQAAIGATPQGAENANDVVKRNVKIAESYRGVATQIRDLTAKQKALSDALKLAKPGSDEAQALKDGVADIGEKITELRKRAAGAKDREPEQLRRAALDADISALQDAFAKERDALQFHNRFLQGEYQAGNLSLRSYYADRRANIAAGVDAEIAELQREKDRLAIDRDAVAKTDPSEAKKLQARIDGASAEQERLRVRSSQDLALANQEEAASFKALSDQVVNYKANLLQLQGDEIGAARLRAQQTIEQASILSRQTSTVSTGEFSRVDRGQTTSSVDVETLKRTIEDNLTIQRARQETNRITQTLQIEEERIALQQQTGAITETAALQRIGEERRRLVVQLEEQVEAQERVAASRPNDTEFALSTQRARLELEKLKATLDPLADKMREVFQGSGADALADVFNGAKSPKAAIEAFGKSVATQINNQVAADISASIFGKDGTLGGVFTTLFGSKTPKQGEVKAGPLETTAVTQSLATLQTAGIDPTTSALTRLQVAADAAAGAVGRPAVQGAAVQPVVLPALAAEALPTTGDLARADRAAEAGTDTAADSAQALSTSLVATGTTAQQFAGVLGPATAVLAGMGQAGAGAAAALSLLPAIVQAFAASSAASGASSSGGGIFSSIGSLFSSGGSKPTTGDFARMDRLADVGSESGGFFASVGNFFSSFFHSGGVVGQKRDMRAVNPGVFEGAGKMHSGGIVGGEALASLKANEVPAILLGGPKGVREEVLTAADPRHKDNLSPVLLKTIQDAQGNPASVLSVIASGGKGGGEGGSAVAGMLKREQQTRELSPLTKFLIGSPETVQGLVSELSKEADFESVGALRDIKRVAGARELGGPVSPNSLYRVNERKPELLEVAGKQYLMTGSKGGEVKQQPEKERAIPPIVLNQQFAPGTDRRTINQAAAAGGEAVQTALARFR